MKYNNQTVIVTGGTRGIGAGLTKAFLNEGAKVIATYGSNDQAAEEFKSSLGEAAANLALRKFDVSKASEVDAFYQWVEENYAKVEVLVNNSGIRKDQLLASMSLEEWKRVLEVNLDGTFLMTQKAVLLMMKARYGRIVNISSVGGRLGLAGQANYAASKAAQVAMSKSLSKEVGKRGITVNNVAPGFIETELLSDLPEDLIKEYKKTVPLKRFGTVEEVASAVLYLASREASYITGETLEISGGL